MNANRSGGTVYRADVLLPDWTMVTIETLAVDELGAEESIMRMLGYIENDEGDYVLKDPRTTL